MDTTKVNEQLRDKFSRAIDLYEQDKQVRPNVRQGITPKEAVVEVLIALAFQEVHKERARLRALFEKKMLPIWGEPRNSKEVSNNVINTAYNAALNDCISELEDKESQ